MSPHNSLIRQATPEIDPHRKRSSPGQALRRVPVLRLPQHRLLPRQVQRLRLFLGRWSDAYRWEFRGTGVLCTRNRLLLWFIFFATQCSFGNGLWKKLSAVFFDARGFAHMNKFCISIKKRCGCQYAWDPDGACLPLSKFGSRPTAGYCNTSSDACDQFFCALYFLSFSTLWSDVFEKARGAIFLPMVRRDAQPKHFIWSKSSSVHSAHSHLIECVRPC